jgi:hypothetical protein
MTVVEWGVMRFALFHLCNVDSGKQQRVAGPKIASSLASK